MIAICSDFLLHIAISIGSLISVSFDLQDKTDIIYEKFLDISSYNREFIAAITKFTDQRINDRIAVWENALRGIIDNSEPYFNKLVLKRRLFDSYPQCSACKRLINTIEEAEIDLDKLYHRTCYIENVKSSEVSIVTDIPVKFMIKGITYECINIQEALILLVEAIDEMTNSNPEQIEKLSSLDFISFLWLFM